MLRSRLLAVAASCAAIVLVARGAVSQPEGFDPSRFGFGGPSAELLILGTFHFKDAGLNTYKPQHDVDILSAERQAELDEILDRLEAWGPTRIAVEWDRDEQARLDERYAQYLAGDFEISSNEIYQLGFRLGKRLAHERLWAVDADSRFYEPRVDREEWAKQHGQEWIFDHPWHERFERLYSWDDERKTRVPLRETLLYMNSPERLAIGHGHYFVGGFKAGDGTEYPGADHLTGWWYVRNLRIFSSLLQLARESDDKVLLIVGAGHVPILRHAALSAPDVELIEVAEVLK